MAVLVATALVGSLLWLAPFAAHASQGDISTVAGDGSYDFGGDDGPATSASLRAPTGVAVDAAGNVFIADMLNHRIRMVSPDGIITTLAGSGEGFNDGPIAGALFSQPADVVVDHAGNIYVADSGNTVVRKIDMNAGTVTMIVGGGSESPMDTTDPTDADIGFTNSVDVDAAGNLYVASHTYSLILRIDANTGQMSVVAGTSPGFSGDGGAATSAQLAGPNGVAVGPDGSVFIADTENRRIRRVDGSSGIITTIAGGGVGDASAGGPATGVELLGPYGVAVDALGTVYFGDESLHRVFAIDASTGDLSTVAGTGVGGFSGDGGSATAAQLNVPRGLAFAGGDSWLLIVDGANNRIRQVELASPIPTVGLVDPAQGQWHLRNSQGVVKSFYFGNPGDLPFVGDWNCDGVKTPGLYRQSDGFVYLRNSNSQGVADITFFFGNPGDVPIVGDFNVNGCDTVSIYRPSNQTIYIINALGQDGGGLGAAAFSYVFGNPGDKPFTGDFNGNGQTTVGLHRESTGFVYYRNTLTQGAAHHQFFFGDPGDRFVTGDWNGNGVDSPGIFRPGNTTFYFRFTNTQGNADAQFVWGQSGWLPIAGNWGLG